VETEAKAGQVIDRQLLDPVPARSPEVLPPCESNAGRWRCLTHRETFRNNLETAYHVDDTREHLTVWICAEHGPEGPA
jgi:hypothetical protein